MVYNVKIQPELELKLSDDYKKEAPCEIKINAFKY